MRICYLAHAHSVHTMKWVKHFIERGHEVSLMSFNDPMWQARGLKFHKLKKVISTRIDFILNIGRVKRLLAQISPDILHAHYATDYGMLGALSGFHPFVLSVWGADIFITPKRSLMHGGLVKFNLSKADVVCSTSNMMAAETKKYLLKDREVKVTPFGVDIERFKPASRPQTQDIVIGTIKSLVRGKGYGTDLLINIFSQIARHRDDLKLTIVGDGDQRIELRGMAEKLGIANKVEFLGRLNHSEIPGFLSSIDIYCCLSRSDNESFGVALLEASSCGKPLVASRVGGLPEVVLDRETGFLVDPNDPNDVKTAILKLVEDDDLRRTMGERGREFVLKNYDWRENARIMENIYESIIVGRGLK